MRKAPPASQSTAKILLVLVMIVWGGSFIASKVGLDGMYPIELATLRFAIATPVLLAFTLLFYGWRSLIIEKKDLWVLVGMAMTGITLQYITQLIAMTYTTVTNTALLINMGTFFVVIPSIIFLKEKFNVDNLLGIVIAFAGLALVVTNGKIEFSPQLIGDGIILISAALWAVYILIGNKLAGKYSVLTQLNYIFVIGFIGLLPFYFLTPHHDLSQLSTVSWASLLYLAIFCSIIAYFFFNDAIIKIGPSKSAIYQYLEPVFAVIFAILLLNEPLTGFILVGGIMTVLGIGMADNNIRIFTRRRKKPVEVPAEPPDAGHH
ncbi:predicted transporter (DMT superfamily) [Methanocella arvoryzae MRE50]|uniref:Predicted transporter (DMT superfamily) n=1 Tax=Methanocella arvoryzae (strain DSM 22066 / NBRC 105507 / MRE50) TaxID=351160 RepID=Q0W0I9_METAR|nr:predicted transporter (DMT superfamily) [Methanocella arvoryzae MRE50]